MSDQTPPQRDVLSVKEVAVYLGLSESTVRSMIRRNEIPFIKIRRRYLFQRSRVNEWLAEITRQVGTEQHIVTGKADQILRGIPQ